MTAFPDLRIGTPKGLMEFTEGQPIVQRINSREFRLVQPYAAIWTGGRVDVPRGFICDLSSVPRPFWAIVPKSGLHDGPSVLHDWAYQEHWRSRTAADLLFLEAMKVAGTWWLRRQAMYAAVRAFGWALWER